MPKKNTSTKVKRRKIKSKSLVLDKAEILPEYSSVRKVRTSSPLLSLKNIILAFVLIVIVLLWKFKGVFIAALVNGQPISRMYLNSQLLKRFGDQVLDNIISERLILAAAREKGVFITTAEINQRIEEIEKRLEGKATIEEALKVQGLTKEDFRRQIEIQLSIDKIFDSQASVSASDIDDYIEKNKQYYKNATDPVALRQEVKDILRQQETAELFDSWFAEIRKNAKINKFL